MSVGTSFGAQERGLHGSALRTGQPMDCLVCERAEQVTNGNVGKRTSASAGRSSTTRVRQLRRLGLAGHLAGYLAEFRAALRVVGLRQGAWGPGPIEES